MAKLAEDDRIEQMNAQRRRMRQQEHRREVERLIQERRREFQRQKVRQQGIIIDGLPLLQILTSLGGNFETKSTLARTELTQKQLFFLLFLFFLSQWKLLS